MHDLPSPLFDTHDAFVWMVIENNMTKPTPRAVCEQFPEFEGVRWAHMSPDVIAQLTLSSPARVRKSLKKLEQGGRVGRMPKVMLSSADYYRIE